MHRRRNIVTAIGIPTLVVGLLPAACAYSLTAEIVVAAVCLTGSVLTGAVAAIVVGRHVASAQARLRCQDLCTRRGAGVGFLSGIVDEAARIVDSAESRAADAAALRAQFEAREHIQNVRLAQLEAAIEMLRDGVFVLDNEGRLQLDNLAARQLMDAVGAAEDRLEQLEKIPALPKLFQECLRKNRSAGRQLAEFELRVGDEPRTFGAMAERMPGNRGIVMVVTDRTETELARTRHAEFVSSVSHELKTPMASIKAYIELLMDGDAADAEEQQELYGFIDGQIDRLTEMVNEMLNLARIESGVIKIQREDIELNDTLNKAVGVVVPVAAEKEISLVCELSDLYLPLHGDGDLFSQAILNLLSNAVKYTPSGGEVRIKSRMDDDKNAVIEIRDNGMGIPAESLPHIFDRFYRVPENNKAASGTGLGLAFVHYVITDIHSGSIAVDSVVDQGTTITIRVALGHLRKQKPVEPVALSSSV